MIYKTLGPEVKVPRGQTRKRGRPVLTVAGRPTAPSRPSCPPFDAPPGPSRRATPPGAMTWRRYFGASPNRKWADPERAVAPSRHVEATGNATASSASVGESQGSTGTIAVPRARRQPRPLATRTGPARDPSGLVVVARPMAPPCAGGGTIHRWKPSSTLLLCAQEPPAQRKGGAMDRRASDPPAHTKPSGTCGDSGNPHGGQRIRPRLNTTNSADPFPLPPTRAPLSRRGRPSPARPSIHRKHQPGLPLCVSSVAVGGDPLERSDHD